MNKIVIILVIVLIAVGIAYSQGMIKIGSDDQKQPDPDPDPDPGPTQEQGPPPEIHTDLSTSIFPHNIQGLSGRYLTSSYNPDIREWRDVSGKENDITIFKGNIKKTSSYVYGGVGDGMKLPLSVLGENKKYTFFWVARYNGVNTKNIFEGVDGDWLSGFYSGHNTQAKRGEWITSESSTLGTYAWVQGTDAPNKFRAFGEDKVNDPTQYGTTSQITVNMGPSNETSDWAIKEMVIYDRLLSLEEIKKVEEYFFITYFPELPEDISMAKGFVAENRIVDDPRGVPEGWGTMEHCRATAEELGYPIWGHTSDAVDPQEKDKCFFYTEGAFDAFTEDESDETHVIGCVTSGKDVLEGCKDIEPDT